MNDSEAQQQIKPPFVHLQLPAPTQGTINWADYLPQVISANHKLRLLCHEDAAADRLPAPGAYDPDWLQLGAC